MWVNLLVRRPPDLPDRFHQPCGTVKVTVSNIFKISLVWALWHTTATSTDSLLCTSMEEELSEEHSEPAIGVASDGTEEPQEADTQKDKNHWHRRGLIRRRVVGYGGCLRWQKLCHYMHYICMQQQQHHPCLQRLPYNNHLGNVLVRVSPLIHVCDYCNTTEGRTCENLHAEYAMIKYPHTKWSIQSEKLLHVDKDNLVSCHGMVNSLVIFVVIFA